MTLKKRKPQAGNARNAAGCLARGVERNEAEKWGDRIVRYHRTTGIRLPETHPEFTDAWVQAEALRTPTEATQRRRRPVMPGTLAAVICDMLHRHGSVEALPAFRP